MRSKIVSFLISAAVLLSISGAGAWFYRQEIGAWWSKQPGASAEPGTGGEVDHSKMDHSGHAMPQEAKATTSGERKILYWYDPMHPAYKSDKPGTAPDCGMDLVPMYANEMASGAEMTPGSVQITAQQQQLIGVKTATVERRTMERVLRSVGKVTIDESKVAHIHTKFSGYIEHVYADFVGKQVNAGEPLFTIYSPELVATQQEYLIALRAREQLKDAPQTDIAKNAERLVTSARERLYLWDIHDDEISRLERERKVNKYLTIDSPVSGVILERAAYHHGRYVTPELDLYMIADLSTVWVVAELYEFEAPYVSVGQAANIRLSYLPEKVFNGRVSFIFPSVDAKTRTVRARIELANPRLELRPEMFADVELRLSYASQIVVPQSAVLDSGMQQTVFIAKEDGFFEPRTIKTGPRLPGIPADAAAGEMIVVQSGLRAGERIVTSANFLIDSESRLKSAMGAMQHAHQEAGKP
jgi:RND family efflux transporter MFP subunit